MIIKKSVLRAGILVALAVFAALAASFLRARPAAANCSGTYPIPPIFGEESCTVTYKTDGVCDAYVTCTTGPCTTVYRAVSATYTETGVRNASISPTVVSHSCTTAPALCGLWIPDVGDAHEKGLIGTNAPDGATILIATAPDLDSVVAVISSPFAGFDTFQVPEQYRSEQYWFKADVCGRWHGGHELGFDAEE